MFDAQKRPTDPLAGRVGIENMRQARPRPDVYVDLMSGAGHRHGSHERLGGLLIGGQDQGGSQSWRSNALLGHNLGGFDQIAGR